MADEQEKKKDNPRAGDKKFSDKQKADAANVIISILDSQVATLLRKKVAPRVPEWMRSPAARQLAGPFRALIETVTGDKHWLVKTFGEKVGSDYLDMLFTILGGESKEAPDGTKKATSRFGDFLAYADKCLREAEDPVAEWERLKEQFRLRQELEAMIEEARKAQEERETERPEREPIDWGAKWRSVKEKTDRAAGATARSLGGLADRLEQRARDKGRI